MKEKIRITAPIKVERKSKAREKAVASVLELPKDRQPDLMYFSAILVSSGENLNHAFFMPSELVKAEGTIINKAVDKEHEDDEVIGHIYDRIFLDKKGNPLDLEELSEKELSSLDTTDMDIGIAGIIYKNRFPEIAEEVKKGDWCVSMEAYFSDYDIKIGNVIIPRKEAEALGISAEHIGKEAQVVDENDKEIAEGSVARILRNILFTGCGIVKTPANPDSVFLEAANLKEDEEVEQVALINIEDKVKSGALKVEVNEEENEEEDETVTDAEEARTSDSAIPTHPDDISGPGIESPDMSIPQCAHFKRHDYRMVDGKQELAHSDWCSLYDTACTSTYREKTDPECLYYIEYMEKLGEAVASILKEKAFMEKYDERLEKILKLKIELEEIINSAAKKCDRGTHHTNMPEKKKKKKNTKKKKKNNKNYKK